MSCHGCILQPKTHDQFQIFGRFPEGKHMSIHNTKRKARARFIKQRYADPDLQVIGNKDPLTFRVPEGNHDTGFIYFDNGLELDERERWIDEYHDDWDVDEYNHAQSLYSCVEFVIAFHAPSSQLRSSTWIGQLHHGKFRQADPFYIRQSLRCKTIEDRVHEFQGLLADPELSQKWPALANMLIDSVAAGRNIDILRDTIAAEQLFYLTEKELLFLVILYSVFWIRSPDTWNRKGGIFGLIEHLFVEYEPPKMLYLAWLFMTCRLEGDYLRRKKHLCWFIIMAQGGSLKRAAAKFGWKIPRGFQSSLAMAQAQLDESGAAENIDDLCAYAEILRLGGTLEFYIATKSIPGFNIDPTDPRTDADTDFWKSTVDWMAQNGSQLAREACKEILHWAIHKNTEFRRANWQQSALRFKWSGRSLNSVLRSSREHFFEVISRPTSSIRWRAIGLNWNCKVGPDNEWTFVELVSEPELFYEGMQLHHCVNTYCRQCATGEISIVSMRLNRERVATIEIRLPTLHIVQARGACNRMLSADEQMVLGQWSKAVLDPMCRQLRSGTESPDPTVLPIGESGPA